jgi:peptidoglycan-N-acetylglucosamine deacetylase
MRLLKKLCSTIPLLVFATSCSNDETFVPAPYAPGIIFSFDDVFADEWCDADDILGEYNWKATFFIARYGEFTPELKNKLYTLELKGHEIAGHGFNHTHAPQYTIYQGIDRYIQDEITPMFDSMVEDGYSLKTFAYPYGERTDELDKKLLEQFNVVRGTTYGQLPPDKHNCFYDNNRVVYALGIDDSYAHSDIEYLKSLMLYAKQNNKIVLFYGHETLNTISGNYQTNVNKLKELCRYSNQLGLKFYTVNDLFYLD